MSPQRQESRLEPRSFFSSPMASSSERLSSGAQEAPAPPHHVDGCSVRACRIWSYDVPDTILAISALCLSLFQESFSVVENKSSRRWRAQTKKMAAPWLSRDMFPSQFWR